MSDIIEELMITGGVLGLFSILINGTPAEKGCQS